MTTERDPHRQDRIMDAAENLTTVWRDLGPMGRRNVNERVGYDLYKALHALAIEVEGRAPLPDSDDDVLTLIHRWGGEMYRLAAYEKEGRKDDAREAGDLAGALMRQIKAALTSTTAVPDEDDGAVNGAPGVTGFAPPIEIVSDGADSWTAQLTRREALQQARKSWAAACDVGQNVTDHARSVTRIAQAFERYLTDGTVHPADEGREPLESGGPVQGRRYPDHSAGSDLEGTRAGRHAVMNAAGTWVERAHLRNPAGLENWRNWADDHDVHLINAVLRYRGMPPIESEKP